MIEEVLSLLKWMLRGFTRVFVENLIICFKTDIKSAYVKGRKKVFGMHRVRSGTPGINSWIKITTLKKYKQLNKDINNKLF